jgi:hypothetical protein
MITGAISNTSIQKQLFQGALSCLKGEPTQPPNATCSTLNSQAASGGKISVISTANLSGVELQHGDSCPVGGREEFPSPPRERAGDVTNLTCHSLN